MGAHAIFLPERRTREVKISWTAARGPRVDVSIVSPPEGFTVRRNPTLSGWRQIEVRDSSLLLTTAVPTPNQTRARLCASVSPAVPRRPTSFGRSVALS